MVLRGSGALGEVLDTLSGLSSIRSTSWLMAWVLLTAVELPWGFIRCAKPGVPSIASGRLPW